MFTAGCSAAPLYPQQDASPDGRLLAEPRGRVIELTFLKDGSSAGTLPGGHDLTVTAVHFSAEGDRLVSGDLDGRIVVWDPGQKKKLGELSGHTGAIGQFAVRVGVPDLASASADGTIKLWDLKAAAVVRTLTGHRDAVLSVAMSPDGQVLASGSRDATLKVWNVDSGAELRTLPHPAAVRALEFDRSASTLAAGCDDGTIRIWDLRSGRTLLTVKGATDPIRNLFFSGDGRWLVAYQSARISIWDTSTGVAAVEDYTIEAALSRPDWPFRAVMADVSKRALHQ